MEIGLRGGGDGCREREGFRRLPAQSNSTSMRTRYVSGVRLSAYRQIGLDFCAEGFGRFRIPSHFVMFRTK